MRHIILLHAGGGLKAPAVPPYWGLYGVGSALLAIRGRYNAVPEPPCRVWDGHAVTIPKHQPTPNTRSTSHQAKNQTLQPYHHNKHHNTTHKTHHNKHHHTYCGACRAPKECANQAPHTTPSKHPPKTNTRRPTTGQAVPWRWLKPHLQGLFTHQYPANHPERLD